MRADYLMDFYDPAGALKDDERRCLTPGTLEFAQLDATIRAHRSANPSALVWQQFNSAYVARPYPTLDERHDPSLPAFTDRCLRRLLALLNLGPRSQVFVLEDDERAEELLETYAMVRKAALALPSSRPATSGPLVTAVDFEIELARDFARLYALRGVAVPSELRLNARATGSGRPLTPLELADIARDWSDLAGDADVSADHTQVTCRIDAHSRVAISADAVTYVGAVSDDAIRLGLRHAQSHWRGTIALTSTDEEFILRALAFAELLGITITSHRVEPHQQASYDETLQRLRVAHPQIPAVQTDSVTRVVTAPPSRPITSPITRLPGHAP